MRNSLLNSLLGSRFYQDRGAGLEVCFNLKCAFFFVFVTVARGCHGPSNLYHVLIIPGNGQGPAGGWGWENGLS